MSPHQLQLLPQSALRILDCFLLEGPKVLFRVGLGVLKVNARHLLSITDPVALFQTLKEIAKHTFDIDQLLKVEIVTAFHFICIVLCAGCLHWNGALSSPKCPNWPP